MNEAQTRFMVPIMLGYKSVLLAEAKSFHRVLKLLRRELRLGNSFEKCDVQL